MSFRDLVRQLPGKTWSIALSTHLESAIPNCTQDAGTFQAHHRAAKDAKFDKRYKRKRAPVAGYNCFGMVFGQRRTEISEDLRSTVSRILLEDGFGQVEKDQLEVGDVVLYWMGDPADGEPFHAARVVRIDGLVISAVSSVPIVLSKFDSLSGEYEHPIDDHSWADGMGPLQTTYHRDRTATPAKWPSCSARHGAVLR